MVVADGARTRTVRESSASFAADSVAKRCARSPTPRSSAIAQLVDKSLVRADGAGRFSLHPLLQQFAAEKLAASPDAAAARISGDTPSSSRTGWPAIAGVGQVDLAAALPALDDEIDNCLVRLDLGHRPSASGPRPRGEPRAARVLRASRAACATVSTASPGRPAAAVGRRASTAPPDNVDRARATLSLRMGRYDDAERHARLALQRFQGRPRRPRASRVR